MRRFFVVLILALLATGCSLKYDFTECKNDSDCSQFSTDGLAYTCVQESCVAAEAGECKVDADCADRAPRIKCEGTICVDPVLNNTNNKNNQNDVGDDATDMTSDTPGTACDYNNSCASGEVCTAGTCVMGTTCTKNADCAGATDLCIANLCVNASSPECAATSESRPDIGWPYAGGDEDIKAIDDFVVIGSILPMSAPTIGPPLSKSIQLALDEITRDNNGLPGGRRIIWINCDDRGDRNVAKQAASHLAYNLGAPAIVGPLFSTPFITVVTDVTKEAGIYTVTPTATADSITNLLDDGLAWRTIAPDRIQANAIASRVKELQAGSAQRPAIFFKNDAYGNGLFNQLNPKLQTIVGAANIKAVRYADPASGNFDQAERDRAIADAASHNPNLLIFLGTNETATLALDYFDANTPIQTLFSHGGATTLGTLPATNMSYQPLAKAVGQNIFDPSNFAVYQQRFDIAFPGEPPLTISTITYDATILTLFGMAAVPEGETITGAKIAANMAKLVDKDGIRVSYGSATFISDGIAELLAGRSFDYLGVSGEVDFDLATGDVRQNFLGLTTIQDQNNQWQLAPDRFYLLAPDQDFGMWFDFCGGSSPNPTMPYDCGFPASGRACQDVGVAELCLTLCNPADNPPDSTCATGLTCVPDQAMPTVGACAPVARCDVATNPPQSTCASGQTCTNIGATGICVTP